MTRRMTREELLIEKAQRDHWFARENAKVALNRAAQAQPMSIAQEAKLIDRGLVAWWN